MRAPEDEVEVRRRMAERRQANAAGGASAAHARWAGMSATARPDLWRDRLVLWRKPWHELTVGQRRWVMSQRQWRAAVAEHQREASRLISEVVQAMHEGGGR